MMISRFSFKDIRRHLEIALKKDFLWWFFTKYPQQFFLIWLEAFLLFFFSTINHWLLLIAIGGSNNSLLEDQGWTWTVQFTQCYSSPSSMNQLTNGARVIISSEMLLLSSPSHTDHMIYILQQSSLLNQIRKQCLSVYFRLYRVMSYYERRCNSEFRDTETVLFIETMDYNCLHQTNILSSLDHNSIINVQCNVYIFSS